MAGSEKAKSGAWHEAAGVNNGEAQMAKAKAKQSIAEKWRMA
jgi:hypothetical protein